MAGLKGQKNKKKCERYRAAGKREASKQRRVARDASRAKPLPCGHGSRHLLADTKGFGIDGCRRCYGEAMRAA